MISSPPKKINVWSQTKSKRTFVGSLFKQRGCFVFCYDEAYVQSDDAVALGPEFPLVQRHFSRRKLFASLADRIPEKRNPAYADYCYQWGIDPKEKDPFVLLTTIGRRGPSTFVFDPDDKDTFDAQALKKFRQKLQLNQREFAALFGLYQATLARLESGKAENENILRYLKLCAEVPCAMKWLLEKRGQQIHDNKRVQILKEFKEM